MSPFVHLAVVLSLTAGLACAQSSVASGELHGTVADPSGALVPAAAITVENSVTGLTRTVPTDDAGEYRVPSLPPGAYSVKIQKRGFRTQVSSDLRITVGQIAVLESKLELGVDNEIVMVTSQAPMVESERSHQAETLQQEWIQNLPINRRDYLTYTLLAPGVVDATALADNADFRVKQTPHSGLSFYGSNGRGNSVTVDGGEMNDTTGGVRENVSQDAVEEFQINRSNYSAELGGATGGVINIVTRAGTNQLHGSLFGYFRNDALDAGNPFARVLEGSALKRIKPPSRREQFGGNLGGPLRRDRTFFFAAFEGLIRNESSVVSLLTDPSIFGPTPDQEALLRSLPAATAAPLRALLTSPQSTIDLFQRNSGVFPFPTHDWKFSARLDHQLGSKGQLFFRHSYAHLHEQNANLQALVGATRGTEVSLVDPTTIAGWTQALTPRLINDLRAQWNYHNLLTDSVEKYGPEIRIQGYGVFNHDWVLPTRWLERRYDLKDHLTWQRGNHSFKFGAQALIRGIHAENKVFFAGRFTFGDLPGSVLGIPGLPDSFTLNALQTFNLGLAQTFLYGAGNPVIAQTYPYYGFFAQDSWKLRPNLTIDIGVRYELDTHKAPLRTDTNNLAPRIAFAWNPSADKKTTVRGGYGIFYAPIYFQIDYVVQALNVINGNRQIAQVFSTILDTSAANSANVFSTLRAQNVIGVPTPSRSITTADLAQFGMTFTHSGSLPPFTLIFENAKDFVNPYSQQSSLSVERQFGQNWALSLEYAYVRTLKITRLRDRNLKQAPVDPTLGIRVWSDPVRDFVDPLIAQRNIFESSGRAFYSGMIVELRRRLSRSLSLDANYTLSRATDEVTDYTIDYEPTDQTNMNADRALSSFHEKHKFVAYAMWTAPGSLQFTPIFRANSGRPFNLLVGYDLNGDRHDTTDRPAGAGRNTGIGPDFWSVDLRVGRSFKVHESTSLDFTAEAFNLFNHLNYASINNVVGNISGPFDLTGRADRTPSQPLGFTSAFDSRRIQLGARVRF